MTQEELHLTKSHLLRRLLQRQVEQLEAEKAALQDEVVRLEQGVLPPQVAESSEEENGFRAQTEAVLVEVRLLNSQARREAAFTLKMTRHEQEKVLKDLNELLQEGARLQSLLQEAVEAVHALDEQVQGRTILLVREANLKQERLIIEARSLYRGRGSDPTLRDQKRMKLTALAGRANEEVERLKREAHEVREQLVAEIASLHHESQHLREQLTRALEHAHALCDGCYLGAARSLRLPPTRFLPPKPAPAPIPRAEAPDTPKVVEMPQPPILYHTLVTQALVALLILLCLLGLPRVPNSWAHFLLDYRYPVWILGGAIAYWCLINLSRWEELARNGHWLAERDHAVWRLWQARGLLTLLVPLLTLTTLFAFQ